MNRIFTFFKMYFWLIGLIPIYLFFRIVVIYAQNIPHWDDYALVNFVNKFNSSTNFLEKIQFIFAQHNEHRIGLTRFFSIIIYWLNGNLNFIWMIWMGNMALLGILSIFYKFLKKQGYSINYLIPICFILFQLSLYENTLWGMASVQNYWVVLFALMAIWKISNEKIPYLFTFLATFTSANGLIFLPIIGAFVYFFNSKYKPILIYTFYCAFLLLLYYLSYHKLGDSKPLSLDFSNINKGFFTNLGSVFDYNSSKILATRLNTTFGLGIVLFVAFFASFFYFLFENRNPDASQNQALFFIAGAFIFILGTCLATAVSRGQYGLNVFLTSKYRLYSILAFCFLYLIVLFNSKPNMKKWLLFGASIFIIFIYLNSYFYALGQIKDYNKTEIATYFNGWHKGRDKAENSPKSCFQYQNTFLDSAIIEDTTLVKQNIGKIVISKDIISVTNSEYMIKCDKPGYGAYLEFSTDSSRYVFATNQERMNNKKTFFIKNGNYYTKGFSAQIPLTELPTGNYFINILEKTNRGLQRIPTNYYIEIEGILPKKVIQNW